MSNINTVIRRLGQIDNRLHQLVGENQELKIEVRKLATDIQDLKRSSTLMSVETGRNETFHRYSVFKGVIPSPNIGRSSKDSSFLSLGKELKTAIDTYNEDMEDETRKIPQICQTPNSFSRMVMKTAERTIATCKVFGSHMKTSTYQEMKAVYHNDLQKFQQAHESNIRKLVRLHPVLSIAEGNWGADVAIKRRLIVLKEDAKKAKQKERLNENHVSKNAEKTKSSRPEHVRNKLRNEKEIAEKERGSDTDSDEETEWNHHAARKEHMLSGSESETGIPSDTSSLRLETCALHSDGDECAICEDDNIICMPRSIFKARNFPLANGCHIPIVLPLPCSTPHRNQFEPGDIIAENNSSAPKMSSQTGGRCTGDASGKTTKDNLKKTKGQQQNVDRFKTSARVSAASRINVEEDHEQPPQNNEAKPKSKRRRISSRLTKTNAGVHGNARRNNSRSNR